MEWVKLPASYYLEPRMLRLSDAAEVMYVRSLALAGEVGAGGFIPTELLHHLTRHPRNRLNLARALVSEGYWETAPGGYQIVGWDARHAKPLYRQYIPLRVRTLIYDRDGYACVFCGASEPLSLDHIWPWSLGGSDEPSNLQTLCIPCNMRKGAKVQ